MAAIAFRPKSSSTRFGFINLADGGHEQAALRIARALLRLWDDGGQIGSLFFSPYAYAARLPSIMNMLTKACGEDALRLFLELLQQAATISGKIRYDHYSSRPIADEAMARYDIYDALISAVRRSAEMLIKEDPARMPSIIGLLERYSSKIFVRLALHVLAFEPTAAPDLADDYLINPELIEASWCRHEYAELALAWFFSMTFDKAINRSARGGFDC